MHFINPFKGLIPTEENASSVTIASTDHLSEDMKKNLLKKNPWSYLNVFSAENKKKSKEQFKLMKEKSAEIENLKLTRLPYLLPQVRFSQ